MELEIEPFCEGHDLQSVNVLDEILEVQCEGLFLADPSENRGVVGDCVVQEFRMLVYAFEVELGGEDEGVKEE